MSRRKHTFDWNLVLVYLREFANRQAHGKSIFRDGQDETIRWIAERLQAQSGVLVADEVGMGKTRVAMAAMYAVLKNGGTAGAIVPPGLLGQWKKEWTAFVRSMGEDEDDTGSFDPIVLRTYFSMFNSPEHTYPFVRRGGKHWALVSHSFGVPRLVATETRDTQPHRVMFPMLAKALVLAADGDHQGNLYKQFVADNYWYSDCFETECRTCTNTDEKHCAEYKAAKYLARDHRADVRRIPDIRKGAAAKEFFKDGTHYGKKMIRDLVGPLDLIVIDEAHKSQDDEDHETQLGTLLRVIVPPAEGGKVIALTATPMELRPIQWSQLLHRIGVDPSSIARVIGEFDGVHAHAKKHPDNIDAIRELIEASRKFTSALAPFVTRRRRTQQPQFRHLVGEQACEMRAHPHREWDPYPILYENLAGWQPAVFAMEALGKAAKGIPDTLAPGLRSLLRTAKLTDSRYAAGQESKQKQPRSADGGDGPSAAPEEGDFVGLANNIVEALKSTKELSSQTDAKLRRVAYWARQAEARPGRDQQEHPRIVATADLIDDLSLGKDRRSGEKVLVFGTFLRPLRALRDTLNHRAAIRLLNLRGLKGGAFPLPGAKAMSTKKLEREYKYLQSRGLDDLSVLQERLRIRSWDIVVKKAGLAYEARQERLWKILDKGFVRSLPGGRALKEIGLEKKVRQYLRTEILNEAISMGVEIESTPEEIRRHGLEIWVSFANSFADSGSEDQGRYEPRWKRPLYWTEGLLSLGEIKTAELLTDTMGEKFGKPLEEELRESSTRFGSFAKMLSGGVSMELRSIYQARFNNPLSFPRVLVAQSRVGREGLNLHVACRTVVMFHAEWNPGVIEQQIGRVDRIESFWEKLAMDWRVLSDDAPNGAGVPLNDAADYGGPKIRVHPVVFKGTYDEFQFTVSTNRRDTLNAHLFGELLDEERLSRMGSGGEWEHVREDLMHAAPDFSPPRRTQDSIGA